MQPADIKSVGIIGAGHIGQVMARIALRAGRQVVIANSRGPQSLTSLVEALGDGVTAGTVKDAAAAHIVVVVIYIAIIACTSREFHDPDDLNQFNVAVFIDEDPQTNYSLYPLSPGFYRLKSVNHQLNP